MSKPPPLEMPSYVDQSMPDTRASSNVRFNKPRSTSPPVVLNPETESYRRKNNIDSIVDNNIDLEIPIMNIFNPNDPIRKLYALHMSQKVEVTEVEACLLREIMSLRSIVAGYLEYYDSWQGAVGPLPHSVTFQQLSERLNQKLEEKVTEELTILSNTCAVQTLPPETFSVHVQTLSTLTPRSADSDLQVGTAGVSDVQNMLSFSHLFSDVKCPTQRHNPLVGKVKQMHELLVEKEARIAALSSELATVRATAATAAATGHEQYALLIDKHSTHSKTLISSQSAAALTHPASSGTNHKLTVKQRAASADGHTSASANPLTTAASSLNQTSSARIASTLKSELPPIEAADLVPKVVLANLHKSISEKDALLAEKSEIITAQQKQITWLKEMLHANTLEKEKLALRASATPMKDWSRPPSAHLHSHSHADADADAELPEREGRVSFAVEATTPSRRARSGRSQYVEAMLDALELESQVMSLKNQVADLGTSQPLPSGAASRLASLEHELGQQSILLADLTTSGHSAPPELHMAASLDSISDDISRFIANQHTIITRIERSISKNSE